MSNPRTTVGEASRLGLASWCLYDWANSAFPTIVTTFVFSVYFTRAVADNPVDGAVQWSHSVTAAALAVVLGAPALGAIADGLGRRTPWLLAFTALTVVGTLALWLVKPSPSYVLAGQVLYAAAATFHGFAMVFYDSMLRSIAPPGYIGRMSGWGWALGYGGGLASLVIALVLLVNADPPPFGLDREGYEHVRATSVLAGLWFGLFAIPLFLFTPDRPSTGKSVRDAVQTGLRNLTTTMQQLLANPTVARFLLAHMFYTNGLNTLFAFGGIYAAGTFQMSFTEVLTFGIAPQRHGRPRRGRLCLGRRPDRIEEDRAHCLGCPERAGPRTGPGRGQAALLRPRLPARHLRGTGAGGRAGADGAAGPKGAGDGGLRPLRARRQGNGVCRPAPPGARNRPLPLPACRHVHHPPVLCGWHHHPAASKGAPLMALPAGSGA
jgi:MFS family permease